MIDSFGDELVKLGSRAAAVKALARRIGHSNIGRAAGLGAGVSVLQNAIGSDDPKLIRSALSGAAGGALTGHLFPGWFARGATRKVKR